MFDAPNSFFFFENCKKKKKNSNLYQVIHYVQFNLKTQKPYNICFLNLQISNEFQQAILDDHRKREKLVMKIDEALGFYQRLPRQQKNDLERFITDLVHKCEVKKHELMSPECTILVAGKILQFLMFHFSYSLSINSQSK